MKTQARKAPIRKTKARGTAQLTRRQLASYAQLHRRLLERLREAEQITPAQRARADAEFQQFQKTINNERARADARLLYLD